MDMLNPHEAGGLLTVAETSPDDENIGQLAISSGDETTSNRVSPEVAQDRAFKAVVGMPGDDADFKHIFERMVEGDEEGYRQEAVVRQNLRKQTAALEYVREVSKKVGRPLTTDENEKLMSYFNLMTRPEDAGTIVEKFYSEEALSAFDRAIDGMPESPAAELKNEDPEAYSLLKRQTSEVMAKREVVTTLYQNLVDVYKAQGWLPWIVDQIKTFVPGYQDVKLRGFTDTSRFYGLLGANLAAQADDLLKETDLSKFREKVSTILNGLKEDNPTLALSFASYLLGQTTTEKNLMNLVTLLDLTAIPAVKGGRILVKRVKNFGETRRAMIDTVKGIPSEGVTPSTLPEAAGDIKEAAVKTYASDYIATLNGADNETKEMVEALTDNFRLMRGEMEEGTKRVGLVNKMKEQSVNAEVNFTQALINQMKVNRLPGLEQNIEFISRELLKYVQRLYPEMGDRLLNVSAPEWDTFTNTYKYQIFYGRKGNELFSSEPKAKFAANMARLPTKDYEIVPHGGGYAIAINKRLTETEDFIRDSLIRTEESKAPESWLGSIADWAHARTPEETLSVDHRVQRKTATYGPANYLNLVKELSKPIQQLAKFKNRKAFRDWERIVKLGRSELDENGLPGRFYKSVGEFEEKYIQKIHRAPTDLEVEAYWAYRNILETDAVMRELSLYRLKARNGVEQHNFKVLNGKDEVTSGYIDGVLRTVLPGGEDTIMVLGKNKGEQQVYTGGNITIQVRDSLNSLIEKGQLKVIELWNPAEKPLADMLYRLGADKYNAKIRYVVVNNLDTKALSVKQLPRRGGGHFEYDYDWYIKQARMVPEWVTDRIFKNWYEGDTTIAPMMLRSMGQKFAKTLDDVRIAIKNGDETGAKALAKDIDEDWDVIRGWFKETTDASGRTLPAKLSTDEPIVLVPKNTLIGDMDDSLKNRHGSAFENGTRRGNLSALNQVEFTGERDAFELFSVKDVGTKHNPLYQFEPAQMIDPMPSLNRAMSRIIKSAFMDDYKIFAIEHWLEEARKYLKQDLSEIRYAPYHVFHNPDWVPNNPDNNTAIRQLKNRHYQISQFLGQSSSVDSMLHAGAIKLADMVYGKFGPKVLPLIPAWALSKTRDPLSYLRSITFHAKLGLWNIPQLLVQANGFVNVAAVAGYHHAGSSVTATMLSRWAALNSSEQILRALDTKMTKLNMPGTAKWKTGEFMESHRGLMNSGFYNVGGEYALRNSLLEPRVIENGFMRMLDSGTWFFKEGERAVRIAAWHTAYREFRDKNPLGKITPQQWQKIQERADLLSNNMSRASSSTLHTGIMQFPAQFLAYQIRLAELFWGKRLGATRGDRMLARARMVGWYSAMYGAPLSAGLTGLPIADHFRRYALENGYVVGEQWYKTLFMEGLPSFLTGLVLGRHYSIGDSFGIQGFETLRDTVTGQKDFWETLGGAAYSTTSGFISGMGGLYHGLLSAIRDDGEVYQTSVYDVVDAAKEIASVNRAWRGYIAWSTGKWISKKDTQSMMDDVKPVESILMSVLNVQPQDIPDAHLWSWSIKVQKDAQKEAAKKFETMFNRSIRAREQGDLELHKKLMSNAFNYLKAVDYPPEAIGSLLHRAAESTGISFINRLEWDFLYKNAPMHQRDVRTQALQIRRQLEEQRNK